MATALDLEEGLAYLDRHGKSHEREVGLIADEVRVSIDRDADIVAARQKGRELARSAGFHPPT